jgi:long-subunit acyl-CoA synthetase (AMP-forming)
MQQSSNAALAAARQSSTLGEAFHKIAALLEDQVAIRTLDDEVSLSWRELRRRVDALAGGLAELGVRHGDSIALMLANRPEFFIADLAVVTLGAVPFSIYQTLAPEQIQYVVADAGARVAIIESAFLEQFMAARQDLPDLEHVILIDGDEVSGTVSLAAVEAMGADFEAETGNAGPEDLLTLIYTSGTTGPPKGVQLSHRNLFHVLDALTEIMEFPVGGRVISWLPTAHIAERALNYYLPLSLGGTITTCPDPRQIATYLPRVKPDFFFAVPRIWEKMKAALEAQLAAQPEEQRKAMADAIAASQERVRLRQAGQPVPAELEERVEKADREMFAFVRSLVGLDEAKLVVVGAAPTPREVIEFFHALGIELAEGWGMSETCAIGTAAKPGEVRIGTVGKALSGIEIKLAEDGEILVRGPNIMVGYRNQPEKTAETIDPEGWLHTGDIGEIDEDGYVRIVDRKKELIINAAGKNMSPANIESTMKGASPLIGQICAIGDGRPYNTALIVLDPDFAPAWAAQNGLEGKSLNELARDAKMIAAVQSGIDAGNAKLARVEQIKKFTILPDEWLPGGAELTPTMKLKRKPIAEKYAAQIEAMYS